MRILSCLFPIALAFAACTPIYGPYKGDTGYADVTLQNDTYDVSFVGYDGMNETQAKKYALMRAAELALLHDRPWFEIVDAGARTRILTSDVPTTAMTTSGPRGRYYSQTVTGGYTIYHDRPEAFMRIHLLTGQKENALNARQIIDDARAQDKVEFKDLAGRAATQPQ